MYTPLGAIDCMLPSKCLLQNIAEILATVKITKLH